MIIDRQIDCVLRPAEGRKGSLFIGNLDGAEDVKKLKSLGIKFVITVANMKVAQLKELYAEAGIAHHVIEVPDKRDIDLSQHFAETYELIDENLKKHGVLVHCYVGVSRSATITIAYLMKSKRLSYQKGLQMLKAKRPDVMPNVGFIQQLLQYQDQTISKKKLRAK